MEIIGYREPLRADWEYLVDASFNGTFMHKRDFIDYHGDKFEDCSLMVYKNNKIVGVFPAAKVNGIVVSHPGLTFGGLVYNDQLRGYEILESLLLIKEHFDTTIRYKATPVEFHRHAVSDDLWGLFKLNAVKAASELSAILNPLTTNYEYWPDRKQELSSLKDNLTLSAMNLSDFSLVSEFWNSIVIPNLIKHGTTPVHSPEDICYLYSKFPVFMKGLLARHTSGKMVGGLIIFRFNKSYHVQYSVTNSKGRALGAMSLLHHYMIEHLPADVHSYNFGKSTEENGNVLNHSLYYYKNSFGGGSMNYDVYEY